MELLLILANPAVNPQQPQSTGPDQQSGERPIILDELKKMMATMEVRIINQLKNDLELQRPATNQQAPPHQEQQQGQPQHQQQQNGANQNQNQNQNQNSKNSGKSRGRNSSEKRKNNSKQTTKSESELQLLIWLRTPVSIWKHQISKFDVHNPSKTELQPATRALLALGPTYVVRPRPLEQQEWAEAQSMATRRFILRDFFKRLAKSTSLYPPPTSMGSNYRTGSSRIKTGDTKTRISKTSPSQPF